MIAIYNEQEAIKMAQILINKGIPFRVIILKNSIGQNGWQFSWEGNLWNKQYSIEVKGGI